MGTLAETSKTHIKMPYYLSPRAVSSLLLASRARVSVTRWRAPLTPYILPFLGAFLAFGCAGSGETNLVWGVGQGDAGVGATDTAPGTSLGGLTSTADEFDGPTQPTSGTSAVQPVAVPLEPTPVAPSGPAPVDTTVDPDPGPVDPSPSLPTTGANPPDGTEATPTASPSTTTDTSFEPTVSPGDNGTTEHDSTSDGTGLASMDAGLPDDMMEPVASAFDIDVVFLDAQSGAGLSPAVRQAFTDAQAVWETVIVGDLSDVDLPASEPCFAETGAYAEGSIDDLRIFVLVTDIDGPNGVLGAAAPCLARRNNGLPFAGYMEFDSADLDRFADDGRLDEVVIHEMGHVLGIGSLWARFDLIVDQSFGNDPSRDTHFTGTRAIAAFDGLGGEDYAGAKVPVENVGGEGTANGHWREELLGNELMTSYMTNLEGVLSTITIGSLEDLGYEVNYAAAGDYMWPPTDERSGGFSFLRSGSEPELDAPEPIPFGNDILDIPVRHFD